MWCAGMPPKKKAAKPKAAKKAAPAPVPQPEPAIISTDFLAGHLWSTYVLFEVPIETWLNMSH